MPIVLTVQPEHHRVVAVGRGTVTTDDLASYVAERVRLGVYDYEQLLDLRDAMLKIPLDMGLYAVLANARRAAGVTSRVPRTATVATVGTATFGLARQQAIEGNLKGHEFEVFESFPAAVAWLG